MEKKALTRPVSKLEEARKKTLESLSTYGNACWASTFCTMFLLFFVCVHLKAENKVSLCWWTVICGIPLLSLCGLFCTSVSMAKKEIRKMPDEILRLRLITQNPDQIALLLLNNNSQQLSDHLCLLSEEEKDELAEDRSRFPTPENQTARKYDPSMD